MKVGSFFIKLVSSLFVLVFGLLCLTTTVFLLARNMTSQDSISNYIKNANVFDYPIRDIISNEKSETLRQNIKDEMIEMDIPALVVDDVVDSNELYLIINDYVYKYSRYILYNESKPVFLSNRVLDIVKEKYAGREKKELSSKQVSEVSSYISLLGEKLDQDIFNKSEIDEMLSISIIKKVANIFDSKYMPIVLAIVIIAIFGIISICLNSVKKALNWCSKITIFDGVLLIIASFVEVRVLIMYFNNQGLLDNLAISFVENGFKNMLIYGVILIVVGIIFVSISAVLLKKEHKNSLKKISNKPIPMQDSVYIKETKEEKEEPKAETQEENKEEPQTEESKEKKEEKIEEQPKEEKEGPSKIEEIIIVPVSEEIQEEIDEKELEDTKAIEIEEVEEDKQELDENVGYTEINDEEEQEEIVKEDIDFKPLESVKIDVIYPEKGKDIEFNPEEEEEEIEIL